MDLNKLTNSEKIIGAAGILFFIDSFLPWFRKCVSFATIKSCGSHNAWGNFLSLLAVLVAVIMVAQVVLAKLTSVELPKIGSLSWGQVHLFAGIAVIALTVLQFLVGDDPLNRAFGIFLGILLAAGLAAGGFLRSQEPETATAP